MKSNLDKMFKADAQSEKEGVWFNLDDRTGFLVRRFNDSNPAVKAVMAKHFKPYARQIELGTLDSDKQRSIMTNIFVHACLVDWKGVEINGSDAAFTKEAAVELLLSLPDLFAALMTHAQDFQNYKEDLEALGNS